MKYLEKTIDFKASQFDFTLTPLQITFNNKQAQAYALQLCKGPQICKKFNQRPIVTQDECSYRFQGGQSAVLKLQSQKSMNYDWSFYKITENEQQDLMGSVSIDLRSIFNKYIQSIKKYSKECVKLQNNQLLGQQIAKDWLQIKQKIESQFQIQGQNEKLKVYLRCKIIARCQLDNLVEEQLFKIRQKKLAKTLSKVSVSVSSHKSLVDNQTPNQQAVQGSQLNSNFNQNDQMSYLQIIKHKNYRKEALSDILEASVSNEYSKKFQEMNESIVNIREEESEISYRFLTATRTQNYDKLQIAQEIDDLIQNRSRSNTSDLNPSKQNQEKLGDFRKKGNNLRVHFRENNQNAGEQLSPENIEIKEGVQTAPQSLLSSGEQQNNVQNKGSRIKVICALLVLILLALGSFYDLAGLKGRKSINQRLLNKNKSKKKGQATQKHKQNNKKQIKSTSKQEKTTEKGVKTAQASQKQQKKVKRNK